MTWDYVGSCAAEVFKVSFNMKFFGSSSLKPTMLLTNSSVIGRLHRPVVSRVGGRRLCRRYVNGRGRSAFNGTKALKASQTLDCTSNFGVSNG